MPSNIDSVHLKKQIILLFILIYFLSFASFTSITGEWKLKKYANNVAVYNRDVANSTIKELKAVTQIKSSMSSIIALLKDRDTYPKWVYKCGTSKMMKRISDAEAIYYQNVVAPWPVDNRDFIEDVKVTQDSITKVVYQKTKNMPNFLPPLKGHVRITDIDALWTLTPSKNGMVNYEFQLHVNPGGNIPAWLVNMAATDGPFETTVNLRTWVMKEKYQKATFDFIKEVE